MSVRLTTLANGLRVATDTMTSVESVSVGVWIDIGSRHEPAALNGISHFLEHMVFKGTKRRSAQDIAEEIDAVGGYLNAHTSHEHTAYYAQVLKDDAPLAIDILADILQNPTFDADELGREKDVVCQEIAQTNDTPDDIIFDHFQQVAYPKQPLGCPILGTPAIVSGLNRDVTMEYMARHHTAEHMIVTAAGCIDHDRLVELTGNAFANLKSTTDQDHHPKFRSGALLWRIVLRGSRDRANPPDYRNRGLLPYRFGFLCRLHVFHTFRRRPVISPVSGNP